MAGKRSYADGCAVAHGLELIGERWSLLIVRELLFGPKRFSDLREGLPGVSADMLTQRLRELRDDGVVVHRKLPPPAGIWVYELSDWGAELDPLLTLLARWSSSSPSMPHGAPISVDSLILSLKVLFDARAARGLQLTVALRLAADDFRVSIAEGAVDIAREDARSPDLVLETTPQVFGALLRQPRTLTEVLASGELVLTGSKATARRFFQLFPYPTEPSY